MSAENNGNIPANISAQQWLQVTLASIGDGVITIDAEAKVTFLNPVAEKPSRSEICARCRLA